jgi:hypothetical protein
MPGFVQMWHAAFIAEELIAAVMKGKGLDKRFRILILENSTADSKGGA